MKQKERVSGIRLLVTIVDRGKGNRVASVFGKYGLYFHMVSFGKGTASSETLDYLGLGETDKSLVMSLAPEEKVPDVRAALVEDMKLYSPGKGILFSIPVSSISGRMARQLSAPDYQSEKEVTQMEMTQYSLVLAMVNQGHDEEVMDAARCAGAAGGTLLHCRRVGGEEATEFFGISIREERELVAILVKSEIRAGVMRAILDKAGLGTQAQGIVLSLPVDSIDGLHLK